MSPTETPCWARIRCPWIAVYHNGVGVGRFHPIPLFPLRDDRVSLVWDGKSIAPSAPGVEQPHHTFYALRTIDVYYRGLIVGQFHPVDASMISRLPSRLLWDAKAEALVLPRQRHPQNARHNTHTREPSELRILYHSFDEKSIFDTEVRNKRVLSWLERLEERSEDCNDDADCGPFDEHNNEDGKVEEVPSHLVPTADEQH